MSNLNELYDDRLCTWWSNGEFTVTQENRQQNYLELLSGKASREFIPKEISKVSWSGGSTRNVQEHNILWNEAISMKFKLDNRFNQVKETEKFRKTL